MIRPEDVRFHVPNDMQYDWAETSFFSIYLAEANVTAWTYVVARKGVGAIACDVEAIDRIRLSSSPCFKERYSPRLFAARRGLAPAGDGRRKRARNSAHEAVFRVVPSSAPKSTRPLPTPRWGRMAAANIQPP